MKRKKQVALLLAIAMLAGVLPADVSVAAKKVKLSSKKVTVQVGKTKNLKLKNNKKKAKWTVISGNGKVLS